jgi:hypothetical protein
MKIPGHCQIKDSRNYGNTQTLSIGKQAISSIPVESYAPIPKYNAPRQPPTEKCSFSEDESGIFHS